MVDNRSEHPNPRQHWQLLWLAVLALLVTAGLAVMLLYGASWLNHHGLNSLAKIQAALRGMGATASAASIGLVIAHAFLPYPIEIMELANGAVFGFAWGLFLTWTGSILGALLSYALARLAGQAINRRLLNDSQCYKLSHWQERHGTKTLLAVRLVPLISFSAVNYLAGLSGVPFWRFFWTTALGIVPDAALVVGSGSGLIAKSGMTVWIFVISGLVLLSFMPLLWRYWRRGRRPER